MPRRPNSVVYRVREPFAVFDAAGTPRVVVKDELLSEDDPLVATHRALLQPVTEYVEQATAAPGEARAVNLPQSDNREGANS